MYKILLIILLSFSFPVNLFQGQLLSNEDYITGDDGVVRMYVNVTGHVRNPGTYLAYDTIDFMSMLSLAGGYLKGANLSKILIISKDGQKTKIDLNQILKTDSSIYKEINLHPHDTIYINEKTLSRFFLSSNLPTMLLSLMNMIITLNNID